MTPEQRRARAYAAKALLDDETIKEGWALIEKDILDAWTKPTGWGDERAKANRERLWVEMQVLRNLRQNLVNFAAQARE